MHIATTMIFTLVFSVTTGTALAADAAAGEAKFKQLCSACHGPTGGGDGPAATGLRPAPRDLGDAAWQASVDDAHIRTVIEKGGTAVGLSPMMTPWGHALKGADLDNVVAYIRSLNK
jgi:mono/diheme cytochrome c family protein